MASHTSASASGQGLAHSRTWRAASSSRRSRSRAAAALRISARSAAERLPQPAAPAHGGLHRGGRLRRPAPARSGHQPLRRPGVGRVDALRGSAVAADQHRHLEGQALVQLPQSLQERLAGRGAPQLEDGLVAKAVGGAPGHGHGAASSSSIGTPRC